MGKISHYDLTLKTTDNTITSSFNFAKIKELEMPRLAKRFEPTH
jgi:hypothetical protein